MNANVDSLGDSVSCVKYIIGGMTFMLLLMFFDIYCFGSQYLLYNNASLCLLFCTPSFLFHTVVGAVFLAVDEVLGFHPFLACQL